MRAKGKSSIGGKNPKHVAMGMVVSQTVKYRVSGKLCKELQELHEGQQNLLVERTTFLSVQVRGNP